jgi:hypothetical protein
MNLVRNPVIAHLKAECLEQRTQQRFGDAVEVDDACGKAVAQVRALLERLGGFQFGEAFLLIVSFSAEGGGAGVDVADEFRVWSVEVFQAGDQALSAAGEVVDGSADRLDRSPALGSGLGIGLGEKSGQP